MALYSTGTVTVTNGSTTVQGSGTAWFGALQAGWMFIGPNGFPVGIANVVSDTVLTLTRPYQGATASAQGYECFPTMSLAGDLATAFQGISSDFQGMIDGVGQGKFPDGSANIPGLRFEADPDTGFYRPASNQIGASVGGALKLLLTSALLDLGVDVNALDAAFTALNLDRSDGPSKLEITSRRDGSNYYNTVIKLNGPRSDSGNGTAGVGRACLVLLGSSVSNESIVWICANTASLAPETADDATFKTYQSGLRIDSDGTIQYWDQGTKKFGVNTSGVGTFNGGLALGNETLTTYRQNIVWTPQFASTGGGETITFTNSSGRYNRVGDVIYCSGRIVVDTVSGGSGALRITGLPATVRNASDSQGALVPMGGNGFSNRIIAGLTAQNTTQVRVFKDSGLGGFTDMSFSEVSAGDELYFNLTYRAE